MIPNIQNLMIRYGVVTLLQCIIDECWRRHEHYTPTESTFSVWATIIEKHLEQMKQEFHDAYYE
jgi:hypothetical protein